MPKKSIFDVLILIGRPAAGKSEILNHLENIEMEERIDRFHIGQMDVIDDFPMLWTWFEDDVTSKVGSMLEVRLQESLRLLWKLVGD